MDKEDILLFVLCGCLVALVLIFGVLITMAVLTDIKNGCV